MTTRDDFLASNGVQVSRRIEIGARIDTAVVAILLLAKGGGAIARSRHFLYVAHKRIVIVAAHTSMLSL